MVTTVTGPLEPGALGVTMMHEHVFCDIRSWCHPPGRGFEWRAELVDAPVSMSILGALRRDPYICRDNAVLDDEELAVSEVSRFAEAGGGSLVEMSCVGLRGQRDLLPSVARRTGVNIVAAGGFYLEDSLGDEFRNASQDRLEQLLRADLVGNDTGIPAGVVGEIGTSNPMTEHEGLTLSVAATVAADLGLSLHIHLEPLARDGLRAMELVTPYLPADRVVLGHIDLDPELDHGYVEALAQSGAFLALDTFGLEHSIDSLGRAEPRDQERIALLEWLVSRGYADQIVVSHDVATKTCLRAYGGGGYDHFLRDIAPLLEARGIDSSVLRGILEDAPRELLTVRTRTRSVRAATREPRASDSAR